MDKPRLTAAVLIEKQGKFLLALRNKKNFNNRWIIPGGGVDFGETTEQAAVREFKEETNIDVNIDRLIGYKEIINVPGRYHSIVFFYKGTPKNLDIKAQDDISEARFFSVDEIKNLETAESVRWVLKKLGVWDQ